MLPTPLGEPPLVPWPITSELDFLGRLLSGMQWRFNTRNSPHMYRDRVSLTLAIDPLRHRELVDTKADQD